MLDYPIKFIPILKEKIWGGHKLHDLLHKDSDRDDLGESWEISGVKDNISVVENGGLQGKSLNQLLEEYKGEILGEKIYEDIRWRIPSAHKIHRCQNSFIGAAASR